jgi:hypothetical protein
LTREQILKLVAVRQEKGRLYLLNAADSPETTLPIDRVSAAAVAKSIEYPPPSD